MLEFYTALQCSAVGYGTVTGEKQNEIPLSCAGCRVQDRLNVLFTLYIICTIIWYWPEDGDALWLGI